MSIDPNDEALSTLRQKQDLILKGKTLSANIQEAITSVDVLRTIEGAPTLAISLTDPFKRLLRSNIFGKASMVRLLPFTYEVTQVSKSGTDLTITCEDQVVAVLRQNTKPYRVDPGKMTHVDFAKQLVHQDAKWIKFKTVPNPSAYGVVKSKKELVRGDPTKKYPPVDPIANPPESTWDAINREATARGWRVFVRGVDELWYVPDTYLFKASPAYRLREGHNGVDNIDFDYDEGKPVAEMTVTCRSALWGIPPGVVALVDELGPGDGKWLVKEIDRTTGSLTSTVTLTQPNPVLPEPVDAGYISAGSITGGSITVGGSAGGGATVAPPQSGSVAFDELSKYAVGGGFPSSMGTIMAAIAMAESSGIPTRLNNNPSTGDYSFGLWQINMIGNLGPGRAKEFGITTYDQLYDPAINARAAYKVYQGQGLAAWSTYNSGAYLQFMPGFAPHGS